MNPIKAEHYLISYVHLERDPFVVSVLIYLYNRDKD